MADFPTVSFDKVSLSLSVGDEAPVVFNRFWLRDQCPSLPDKSSGLRTWSVATLPEDLSLLDVNVDDHAETVRISWSDGHLSTFTVAGLLGLAQSASGVRPPCSDVRLFAGSDQPIRLQAADLVPGAAGHYRLLDTVNRHGVALVDGLAHDDGATEELAGLLGRIRHTDFGRVFDIVTEPETWTLSQSNRGQDPHTDDPFRYHPSGISILHCRSAAEGLGGVSIIVDGFAVAEDLRRADPTGFDLLRRISIPFVRRRSEVVDQGEDVNMVAYAPVITTDGPGPDAAVVGIRFHERSTGVFDLTPDVVDRYYLSYRAFAERVRSERFQVRHRLAPGEAFVFDNQRVLHGRTGYEDDTAGRRHLRLCTVDRDQVHSRLRRLQETHDLARVDERTRSGASHA